MGGIVAGLEVFAGDPRPILSLHRTFQAWAASRPEPGYVPDLTPEPSAATLSIFDERIRFIQP